MSLHTMKITCVNDDCEHDFEFEAEFDKGDPGCWNSYSGGWPPEPASFYPTSEEVMCPKCNTDCTKRAVQLCNDHEFEQPEPPEYDFDWPDDSDFPDTRTFKDKD